MKALYRTMVFSKAIHPASTLLMYWSLASIASSDLLECKALWLSYSCMFESITIFSQSATQWSVNFIIKRTHTVLYAQIHTCRVRMEKILQAPWIDTSSMMLSDRRSCAETQNFAIFRKEEILLLYAQVRYQEPFLPWYLLSRRALAVPVIRKQL